MWKSTEHNIDVYVAFARLYRITGNTVWLKRTLYAKKFVKKMWDVENRHFWTGTFEDGMTINKNNIPTDVNTWSLMALGDKYSDGMRWVENNCFTVTDGFKGFDFNNDRDGVWFEGTAHAMLAYKILGEKAKADIYLSVKFKFSIILGFLIRRTKTLRGLILLLGTIRV